ncbi:MAG: CehA/McbA family metallohydrolase [Bacillota bacterium]|nr:CehA/McbA family metallohydrolase [Bacillota bacterium]
MKFDLHCHTKEGSFDSKVPLSEYLRKYRMLGYDGFMFADHNSYRACKKWAYMRDLPEYSGMTVICGIEYDTKDAGHVLVVLPDGLYPKLLKIRGMRCMKLIRLVHSLGGIVGLAHPFGVASSSAMGFKLMDIKLLEQIDFVEVFNTCEKHDSNYLASELAAKYGLPGTSGTDAHSSKYIGMAWTEIDADITCNVDFIDAIKNGTIISATGIERKDTKKGKAKDHWTGILGYKIYNRGLSKLKMPRRKYMHRKHFRNLSK